LIHHNRYNPQPLFIGNYQESKTMSDNQQPPSDERNAWEGGAPSKESTPQKSAGEAWERDVLSRLAFAAVNEQKRTRRWGIFFKILTFTYLFMLFWIVQGNRGEPGVLTEGDHTALVELKGVIADDSNANADSVVSALRDAFKSKGTRGVILQINSPGGSPVQAGTINDEIHRLRKQYPQIPLYAVVTDICASGGYYVAVASDKIYADKASIVGSIGVIMSGLSTFGFVDTMKKLGIERRMMAAGEDKAMLDPFSPLKKDEVKHIKTLLETIHQQFIKVVKEGRGNRLKGDDHTLFNGLYWTGQQALDLGLIDGLGNTSYVAREVIGAEKIVDYTNRPSPLERITDRLGVVMAKSVASVLGITETELR
jgi:protease-4